MYRFGKNLAHVLFDELGNFFGVLIWYKARGKFRVGFRWNHCLCAFASIAAPNAIELKRRTRPQAFGDREAFFAGECGRSDYLAKFLFAPWERIKRFAFGF